MGRREPRRRVERMEVRQVWRDRAEAGDGVLSVIGELKAGQPPAPLDAKAEERANRAEERANRADKRLDRLERIVTQLAVAGRRFRSDVRLFQSEVREFKTKVEEALSETTDKLNALIEVVDKTTRHNGKERK